MAIKDNNTNKALIFIPDISGFTEFVKQVEIDHSQHIIRELLELIIDKNRIGLEISEIEGDAILFYRLGDPPDFEKVFNQCKEMFLAFHQHLKLYKEHLICECGACSSHQSLSLKFIVHFGEVKQIAIKNFNKLHGEELIVAHRLMKNDVPDSEYILFTNNFLDQSSNEQELNKAQSEYSDFGVIEYCYYLMREWLKEVPEAIVSKSVVPDDKNPIHVNVSIDAPLATVYEYLIDNSKKINWVPGLKALDMSNQPLPATGSSHQCIFPGYAVEIETVGKEKKGSETTYIEHASSVPLLGETYSIFRLNPDGESSHLELELRIPGEGFFKKIKKKLMSKKLQGNFQKALGEFKKYVEGEFAESALESKS